MNPRKWELRLFTSRLVIAGITIGAAFLALCLRLGYLQLWQHQHFVTLSRQNEIALKPIPPRRGLIYDRNGLILANNTPALSLVIIPNRVPSLRKTLAELRSVIPISDPEIEQFSLALSQHRRFDEVPLKWELSPLEVARFSLERHRFPGVLIQAQLIRHYPLRGALASVLGYVGRLNLEEVRAVDPSEYAGTHFIGKLGIERYFEKALLGKVGYEEVEADARGHIIRTLSHVAPVQGQDLYLTIDSRLQIAATRALAPHRGAVVAIQPETGEILALVSYPTFDPNGFVEGLSAEDFRRLEKDPDRPLHNRAIRGLYASASTIKPFLGLGALHLGFATDKDRCWDPGWYRPPGMKHVYRDWAPQGHGWVDLEKAIIHSCDIYFYDLAYRLGAERIRDILDRFQWGRRQGIEMSEEIAGTLPEAEWKYRKFGKPWYIGDTVVLGIGQGYLQITPLQLAAGTAMLANRGVRVEPHLLRAIREAGGEKHEIAPQRHEDFEWQDPAAWETVVRAMSQVTTRGTGTAFGQAPYSVAAKTGTAQVVNIVYQDKDVDKIPERRRHNSLFIAFAPIDRPQIAIAVVVENHNGAAKVAREVIDAYLNRRKPQQRG